MSVNYPGSDATGLIGSPSFPQTLIERIVRHLDVDRDRQTLLVLQRVSKAWWQVATLALYNTVKLDDHILRCLLIGKGEPYPRSSLPKLSDRTRLALSFVQDLTIAVPIDDFYVRCLWSVSLPNTPLFSGAQAVVFWDVSAVDDDVQSGDRDADSSKHGDMDHELEPEEAPDDSVLLFDNPHMCVDGLRALHQLVLFPARSTSSFCVHNLATASVIQQRTGQARMRDRVPKAPWVSYRIFDNNVERFKLSHVKQLQRSVGHGERVPPIHVCFDQPAYGTEVIQFLERDGWKHKPTATFQVRFGDTQPPCEACGELDVDFADRLGRAWVSRSRNASQAGRHQW